MKRTGALLAIALTLAGLPAAATAEEPAADRIGWSTLRTLGRPAPPADEPVRAAALAAPGTFEPSDTCFGAPPEVVPGGVECGYVVVPERHEAPSGEAIRLAVALRRATGAAPVDDPLLVLGGGPGEHIVSAFPAFLADDGPFAEINATRDVIVLDQRGVGLGQPSMDCPETLTPSPDPELDPLDAYVAALAACRTRLVDEGVDLSAYDTEANTADLDLVRSALGYDEWNVFGTSYGARLTLQAARNQADSLRTMVLSSPIPAEDNFVADAGPSFDGALDELFAACADDEACDREFGDLGATLDAVIERLLDEPAMVDLTDPATGTVVPVPLTAPDVAAVLFSLFYSSDAIGVIPAVIDEMGKGNYRPLLEILGTGGGSELFLSQGMQLSFLCAEEVARTSAEELSEQAATLSPVARVLVESNPVVGLPVFDLCAMWDVEPGAPVTFEPVTTDVPTLVVTGRFDQITPSRYGRDVADALSNATLVEVPNGGHSPLFGLGECGLEILAEYLDTMGSDLDTQCATDGVVEFLTDVPAVPQARSITDACPPGVVPTGVFADVSGVHQIAIECIAWWGVTRGRVPGLYAPGDVVTRGQMASFIARLIDTTGGELPPVRSDRFADTAGSPHAADIDRLAAVGVVKGRDDGSFGPAELLTRDQMAAFLVRAYTERVGVPLPEGDDFFPDDTSSVHHDDINAAAAAGFTHGYADGTFGPGDPLRRDAIASFLARELDLLVEQGVADLPAVP